MGFLSDEGRVQTPVTKVIKFRGKHGIFTFWDREQEQEFEIDVNHFIPLATRSMVTGFCEAAPKGKGSIWSNEVRDLSTELIKVSIGGHSNITKEGLWKDIKYEIGSRGGKFTPVVYAAMDGEIVRFLFSGAACGPWIEVQREARHPGNDDRPGVVVAGMSDEVKGSNEFKAPVFRLSPVRPETMEEAAKLKATLDEFFIDYEQAKRATVEHEQPVQSEPPTEAVAEEETKPTAKPEKQPAAASEYDPNGEIPFAPNYA